MFTCAISNCPRLFVMLMNPLRISRSGFKPLNPQRAKEAKYNGNWPSKNAQLVSLDDNATKSEWFGPYSLLLVRRRKSDRNAINAAGKSQLIIGLYCCQRKYCEGVIGENQGLMNVPLPTNFWTRSPILSGFIAARVKERNSRTRCKRLNRKTSNVWIRADLWIRKLSFLLLNVGHVSTTKENINSLPMGHKIWMNWN